MVLFGSQHMHIFTSTNRSQQMQRDDSSGASMKAIGH
jgi:hypothetical protein